MPLENPFTYEGISGPWDEQELHEASVKANTIHIEVPSVQRTPTMFGLHSGGTPSVSNDIESADDSRPVETWSLKVTKVGLLNRKDDIVEGGKKSSNRKWRTWSVILTGSQLLFFRDPTWATSLLQSSESLSDEHMASIPMVNFRPDESFSVKDAIAVYDRSYTKVCIHIPVLRDSELISAQSINTPCDLSYLMAVKVCFRPPMMQIWIHGYQESIMRVLSSLLVSACVRLACRARMSF